MLKVYVVDDEPLAIRRLVRMLEATHRAEVIGSTTDPETAIEELSALTVDAVFLDIQMPGYNGFEVLSHLPHQPLVVFTTAFDQYALQAFEVNSIDYLLKPIEAAQLDRALAKLERLRGHQSPHPSDHLQSVISQLAQTLAGPTRQFPERIASRVGERIQFLDLATVTHFFSQDKLTFAVANGKEWVVDYTISKLEEKLDPTRFLRIHRSTLVNLSFVEELHTWFAGQLIVRLKDASKTELQVARDRVRELKERMGMF
ncbi:MAG: response regulator transcription factor [Acidobacteria bacterium]|nr:response regulator transcription factor [Acidobacteriota bacterium]